MKRFCTFTLALLLLVLACLPALSEGTVTGIALSSGKVFITGKNGEQTPVRYDLPLKGVTLIPS